MYTNLGHLGAPIQVSNSSETQDVIEFSICQNYPQGDQENIQQDASSATSIHIFHPQIHEQSSQAHSTLTGGEYSSGLELTEFTRIIKRLIKFIVL